MINTKKGIFLIFQNTFQQIPISIGSIKIANGPNTSEMKQRGERTPVEHR